MRNDDDEARRKAEEDPELREDIPRSVEGGDEREPAQDASTTAQAPTNAPERPQKAMVVSPSAGSSPNGNLRGGPSSPEGKAISRTNSTTHGIFSSVVVLRNESRIDYDALLKGLSEDFQPEGSLESLLVEKLAMLIWRHRRLLLAEGIEVTNTVDRRPLRLAVFENVSEPKRYAFVGMFWGITNVAELQECIDQLTILRDQIEADGLEFDRDRRILEEIYGPWVGDEGELLSHRYEFWVDRSERGDGSPISPPPILYEIDAEIARLKSIVEQHEVDPGSRKIIVRRQRHIPDSPAAERLLRYEGTLERAFERALAQLERMQRIRKGQPVPPRLEVGISV